MRFLGFEIKRDKLNHQAINYRFRGYCFLTSAPRYLIVNTGNPAKSLVIAYYEGKVGCQFAGRRVF